MTRRGFTLMEVLMTVVIIGILSSLAIPTYTRTVERSHWRQAQDVLLAIYTGERAYYFAEDAYIDPDLEGWAVIYMDDPNLGSDDIIYGVDTTGCTPPCFSAVATRVDGPCKDNTLQIDQGRTFIPDPDTQQCWCPAC